MDDKHERLSERGKSTTFVMNIIPIMLDLAESKANK